MVRFIRYNKIFRLYEIIQPYIQYSPPIEKELPEQKILVLAPHSDDEAIGCGGTIAIHKQRGGIVYVVFLTYDGKQREQEARNSCKILGVDDYVFEQFKIGSLKDNQRMLTETVFKHVNMFKPDIIFIPFCIDNHSDHRAVNKAIYPILKDNIFKGIIYTYPIWLPLYPNVFVDISQVWHIKEQAIKSYESQVKSRDYVNMSYGLSRYWAIIKGRGIDAVEIFFRASSSVYADFLKKVKL